MSEEIKDLNLELMLGLRRHLDEADQLRQKLDRLIRLATANVDKSRSRRTIAKQSKAVPA